MELSEIIVYNGKLLVMCDITGIVFEIVCDPHFLNISMGISSSKASESVDTSCNVAPRYVLADGEYSS